MDHPSSHLSFGKRALLAFASLGILLGGTLPMSAQAQLGGPVVIAEDLPRRIDSTLNRITTELMATGVLALVNALQTAAGQLAYDAADYIATGGKGQSAMYYKKGFDGYLEDVGNAALGEFIGSMSQSTFFSTVGYDLCRPRDPRTLLRIQMSLGRFMPGGVNGSFQRPQARCDFADVQRNYEQLWQTMNNGELLDNINLGVNTAGNDLGVSFLIFGRTFDAVNRQRETAAQDRKEGQGYQSLRDIVSGRIRTPSATIREEVNEQFVQQPKTTQHQINQAILSSALSLRSVHMIAVYTGSVFVNTLSSKMLGRIMSEGLDMFDFSARRFASVNNPDDLLAPNREDLRKANISLRTPSLFQQRSYEVLTELQSCPEARGTWNCTMDEGLGQALRSSGDSGMFTIREAIERGYLKADWKLYPSSNTREERDPLCYTYGYCSGNLKKMRAMRILPAGFEFAANDPKNVQRCGGSDGCVTLGEVVDGFTQCNERGEKDNAHPWCKLIDPNWALTIMPQQCALTGFGETALGNGLPQRREECQDIQTCLRRNDAGECIGGYGQCVAEKTVYRFGANECSANFASCRAYTSRTNEQVSYLRNTLDYGRCSQDNVGCLWYATSRDTSGGRSDAWIGTATTGDRVYFDSTLESCEASGEGCTRVLATRLGESSLNAIKNPSFEDRTTDQGLMDAWSPLVGTDRGFLRATVPAGEATADGATAAHFAGGFTSGFTQVIDMTPGRTYAVSGFVRVLDENGATPKGSIGIRQYPTRADAIARTSPITRTQIATDFRTRDCEIFGASGPSTEHILGAAFQNANGTSWARIQCSFTANASTRAAEVVIQGANTLVDAVQLEEGSVAAPYVNGLNTTLTASTIKIAPDDFACTGADTDNPSCANFAKVCRQSEAGCEGYTDTSGGFPELAAQIGPGDFCPAACVGYAEYRKLASSFDLVKSETPDLNDASELRADYFIPRTAQQCSQQEVGCEVFTVADSAAQGGESQAAFASLRFCEQPSSDTDTYFTWEGSDSTGYQLRTWSLKKRTDAKPGDVPPEGATVTSASAPRIVVKRSGDLFSQKAPNGCNEDAWRTGTDPDCRQFYNADGGVFYRYYSQTVLSTEDCRQYRLSASNQDDCTKTGGVYQSNDNSCLYQAYAPESRSCRVEAAGCRAYAGAEAGNTLSVFRATGDITTDISGADQSTESILVGDRSYRMDAGAGRSQTISMVFPSTATGLYRVSFWMKGSAPTSLGVQVTTEGNTNPQSVGTVRVTTEWQQVNLGLFNGQVGAKTRLNFTVAGPTATPVAFFLDEVSVLQIRDVAFVRRNTWNTPAQCDQNAYGVPEPQAMVGCREYQNRAGQAVQVRQFSQLCRPAAIGCKQFIDTRNSTSPYDQAFTLQDGSGPSVTRALGDRYVYLIDEPSKRCDAANASCRAFGKPVFSKDRASVDRYETVYLKDDVTKYGEGLCRPSELFCEEFTTEAGREYFKDPQNHVCDYRTQVAVSGVPGVPAGTYGGWFVKGENTPCYPNALASGQIFLMLRTGDTAPEPGYQGWAGTCPVEQAECTEFRDPMDTAAGATGRSYHFIYDNRIDTRSCNGQVDPARGCVLVRAMSDARLLYSARATDEAYRRNNLQSVTPVDCARDASQPGCTASRSVSSVLGSTGRSSVSGSVLSLGGSVGETPLNDANLVVKVKMDRDCAQWLGCASGETVYDPATNRYKELCTQVALCDKAGEATSGGSFCTNYVNRASTSTEPVLAKGVFFDAATYTSRPTGIGGRDYAGYTIPQSFQVTDLVSRSVSADLLTGEAANAKDKRLVVAVSMPPVNVSSVTRGDRARHLLAPTQANEAEMLPRDTNVALYINLSRRDIGLCRHRGTGMMGYYVVNEAREGVPLNCYLPFTSVEAATSFATLQAKLGVSGADTQDLVLDQAYPRTMCRAYPEADAPYPTSVVTSWDMSKNPVRPQGNKAGFSSANTCAYGEECFCSYKRVTYSGSGSPLFFAADSQAVPPGICVGGPRDGQACLPSEVFNVSNSTSTSARIAEAANNAQSCGPLTGGGRCVAFERAEIVRGVEGACLEYDTTRARGPLGEETYSCLTWNPSPVIGGRNDPYHYVDTAGYFPPQNSGQYYCTARTKNPVSFNLDAAYFKSVPVSRLDYDDDFVSDDTGVFGADGNERGAYFDSALPRGSTAAVQCEDADDHQDDGGYDADPWALRLVATGRGEGRNYAEAFYSIRARQFALAVKGSETLASLAEGVNEQNFSFIEIKPFKNPNGIGRLACGYQEDWVDNVTVRDYSDIDEIKQQDARWQQAFYAEPDISTYLTRGSEKLMTLPDGSPYRGDCVNLSDSTGIGLQAEPAPGDSCYFKTWEIGYRSTDKRKFEAFSGDRGATASFNDLSGSPYYESCASDKPYYAIRAVFQSPDANQSGDPSQRTSRDIRGPWRLTGFWVSTCAGQAVTDNRFIYMNIKVSTADICKEIAEVRSSETGQDAAFTDRVWQESKYTIPVLNIKRNETFAPFSSALNTRSAGADPLYQSGGRIAGVSALNPPVFLASGRSTYFGPVTENAPKDKYGYLTNVFARIYRVYKYNEQAIGYNDRVCATGPFEGRKCVPDALPSGATQNAGPSVDCRVSSADVGCDTTVPTSVFACNALSGINAGASCGNAESTTCHTAALDRRTTARSPVPLLTACNINASEGWSVNSSGQYIKAGETQGPLRVEDAAKLGAFRCASGAVRLTSLSATTEVLDTYPEPGSSSAGQAGGSPRVVQVGLVADSASRNIPAETLYCTRPTEGVSADCPLEVSGTCVGRNGLTPGRCRVSWAAAVSRPAVVNAETDVQCYMDTDCSFTAEHFWKNAGRYQSSSDYYVDGRVGAVRVARHDQWSVTSRTCENGPCTFLDAELGRTYTISATPIERTEVAGITIETRISELDRFPGAQVVSLQSVTASDTQSPLRARYTVGACEQYTAGYQYAAQTGVCPSSAGNRAGRSCLVVTQNTRNAWRYTQWEQAQSCGVVSSSGRTCSNDPSRQCTGEGTAGCLAGGVCRASDRCEPVADFAPGVSRTEVLSVANSIPSPFCILPGGRGAGQTAEQYWDFERIQEDRRNKNTDNNRCTAEIGYVPDTQLCSDPRNEFCGLTAYDMRVVDARGERGDVDASLRSAGTRLPTDVTLGHYTPSYLGLLGVSESSYQYIDYYTPRPPRIAAPATSCPTGASCPVQELDVFSFNGVTQGILNVVGGQQRSTIKFFGWAAHEQMALRRLAVDWGDGFVQSFDDVKLKNRKPFCSVQKECYSPTSRFTGLTCQSDSDCPLSAQACRPMGSCKDKPHIVCGQDSDCRADGTQDTCTFRSFFGNSGEACEASPFEFSHVYACPANAQQTLPSCTGQNLASGGASVDYEAIGVRAGTCYFGGADSLIYDAFGNTRPTCTVTADCQAAYDARFGAGSYLALGSSVTGASCGPVAVTTVLPTATQARCSQDPSRFCRADNDCAAGDRCIQAGLAPAGGCWDAQNNACRYTPRVFLQDNWGWCSGECRTIKTGEMLSDAPNSYVRHAYGGCYSPLVGNDGSSMTRLNTAGSSPTALNGVMECSQSYPQGNLQLQGGAVRAGSGARDYRPWIVFPGSLQLRPRR